jgi:thioredoxin reductase (NADPH)
VALFLVDQRMPQMSGVEFLEQAIPLFPTAKRVLLTAYADTDAAIRAINTARVDYYLLKPWDPPEQCLYPVLDDLLGDWQATFRPPFEGVRVVGHRWSPDAFQMRDFLARHQVPYQWLDVESDSEAQELAAQAEKAAGEGKPQFPLIFLADGTWLADPSRNELAEKIGFKTQAELPFYELIIVGGGPSGLAAAVYGASEGLRTLLIEGEAPGGQAGTSSRIENYLGFPSGLSGADLTRRAVTQAQRFGVEILTPQEAKGVRREDPYRIVVLSDGREADGRRRLLRRGHDGSDVLPRRGRLLRGRRQLRGAGRHVFLEVRPPGDHAGARRFAQQIHVPIPDRSDRGDSQHRGLVPLERGGSPRRGAPGIDRRQEFRDWGGGEPSGPLALRLHRRPAAHELARRRGGAG